LTTAICRLQCREPKNSLRVSVDNEQDRAAAQVANPVKKDDGTRGAIRHRHRVKLGLVNKGRAITPVILIFVSMRVVGEIPHPECKITIFHWNGKYLIKLELGPFEQTFKINDHDIVSEGQLQEIVNEDFIGRAMARFADMSRSLEDATTDI
jgi:hypothetical protein